MPITSTTLTRLLQFAAVLANASAGQPCPAGFSECGLGNRFCCSDNGNIEGVSPAFSENCPPPQLFEEEQGSIVCETECCQSTGTCAFNATKVALKVTGGTGTAQAGYEDGTSSGNTKRCWFRASTGCVYGTSPNASDPTSCGMQLTFVVLKLNDEDQSNSIVAALNDAVSSLFTTELVTIGDYPYWKCVGFPPPRPSSPIPRPPRTGELNTPWRTMNRLVRRWCPAGDYADRRSSRNPRP